jgi:hypothetical protein
MKRLNLTDEEVTWMREVRDEGDRENAELRAEVGEENWPQFLADLEAESKRQLELFTAGLEIRMYLARGGRLS